MKKINLAVVGATGMVGSMFIKVLQERKLPVENYYLFASKKSAGIKITLLGKEYTVEELCEDNIKNKKIDIAIFSAGGSVSETFAPIFVKYNAVVVDNSSCWRMHKDVPLIVPEVNPDQINNHKGIISNPNCSTIQAMVALKPLHDAFKIKRVIYSTYQAVSGAGVGGYNDLKNGIKGEAPKKFNHPIAFNMLPQIDVFLPSGYTKEEQKMIDETHKILSKDIKVTATTVRVPVYHGHSESINIEFEKPCTREQIMDIIQNAPGLVLMDDIDKCIYPMPIDCADKDEVFVGRIRIDDTVKSGCNIWVVADNIRKGAATNTVQIAELLIKKMNA